MSTSCILSVVSVVVGGGWFEEGFSVLCTCFLEVFHDYVLWVIPPFIEGHQVGRMFLKVGCPCANSLQSQKLAVWARDFEFVWVVRGVV